MPVLTAGAFSRTARAMTEPALLTRPQLRRLLRKARRALTPAQQRQAALGLYRQLAQHPLFRRARHISLYLPTDGEIDPRLLLREAQRAARPPTCRCSVPGREPKWCSSAFERAKSSSPIAFAFSNRTTASANADLGAGSGAAAAGRV
jgi:5-formyltetrahydrofolate cyclo-ligase